MRALLLLALALLVAPGCGERGSGVAAEQTRAVGAFSRVRAEGVVQVVATAGAPAHSVVVRADDNLIDKVVTRVSGDTLIIDVEGSITTSVGLRATIAAPTLAGIALSGASRAEVSGLSGDTLEVALSGSSRASLAGSVDHLDAMLSGASALDAGGLTTGTATAEASGASRAEINAARALKAVASGASSIRYTGSPELTKTASGSSSIPPAERSQLPGEVCWTKGRLRQRTGVRPPYFSFFLLRGSGAARHMGRARARWLGSSSTAGFVNGTGSDPLTFHFLASRVRCRAPYGADAGSVAWVFVNSRLRQRNGV